MEDKVRTRTDTTGDWGRENDWGFELQTKIQEEGFIIEKSQALKRVINKKALFPRGHQFSEKHAYVFRILIKETHNFD